MGNSSTLLLLLLFVTVTLLTRASPSFDADDDDGGFSSLDGMLQWAIGHSDPEKLKQSAMSTDDIHKRRSELKQLVDELKMPSDAELMRIAIQELKNSSSSLEDRLRALHDILLLVQPIDNANDFHKLGGLSVVVRELNHTDPDIPKLAAWIIGEAAQNNPLLQNEVLGLGGLSELMKLIKSDNVEEASRGLYAVSALLRNNLNAQNMFYAEAGGLLLQDLLSNPKADIRLLKKAVILVSDLAESSEGRDLADPFFFSHLLLKSLVDLTASSDLDLQEKVLLAIRNVMQLGTSEGVLKELRRLELELALDRMRQDLIKRSDLEHKNHEDYTMDLERLRSQVEVMFLTKIDKAKS